MKHLVKEFSRDRILLKETSKDNHLGSEGEIAMIQVLVGLWIHRIERPKRYLSSKK